mmetsp:Transcript_7946/g.21481  ORF Transcript_7946/g.21481 Transcript_7946/m.21481 type:complete len:217 (+) Transcript_7946:85-735(+)
MGDEDCAGETEARCHDVRQQNRFAQEECREKDGEDGSEREESHGIAQRQQLHRGKVHDESDTSGDASHDDEPLHVPRSTERREEERALRQEREQVCARARFIVVRLRLHLSIVGDDVVVMRTALGDGDWLHLTQQDQDEESLDQRPHEHQLRRWDAAVGTQLEKHSHQSEKKPVEEQQEETVRLRRHPRRLEKHVLSCGHHRHCSCMVWYCGVLYW